MNRTVAHGAAAAALVTLAAAGTASATTHESPSSHTRKTVMTFRAHDDPRNFAMDDLGAPSKQGPGLGDVLAFSQPLTRHGKHAGRINAVSVGVDSKRHLFQNMGTVRLAKGDIEYGGLVEQTSHFTLAITGGTGKYRTARGTIRLSFKGHAQQVRVTLRH